MNQVEPYSFTRPERAVYEYLLASGYTNVVVKPRIRVMMHGKRRRLEPDFLIPEEHTVIEVNGCWVHGCEECHGGQGFAVKRWKDAVRSDALQRAGYQVEVIWEHELETLTI